MLACVLLEVAAAGPAFAVMRIDETSKEAGGYEQSRVQNWGSTFVFDI
jgi:hypothetical protein